MELKVEVVVVPDNARAFVFGDIHGNIDNLYSKIKELGIKLGEDYLFFVGDLVDRGENSIDMLKFIHHPRVYSVLANHEYMAVEGDRNASKATLHANYNGGEWFYCLPKDEYQFALETIKNLPVLIEIHYRGKKFGIVHAEVPPTGTDDDLDFTRDWDALKLQIEDQNMRQFNQAIWNRVVVRQKTVNILNVDRVFLGHTVLATIEHYGGVKNVGNCTYLDTGSVFSKYGEDYFLSAVELSSFV